MIRGFHRSGSVKMGSLIHIFQGLLKLRDGFLKNFAFNLVFLKIDGFRETCEARSKGAPVSVPWYVLRVKDVHFGSPLDSWDRCGKAKPSYAQYIIRQGEAELQILELTSVFHHLPSVGPKQLCDRANLGSTCFASQVHPMCANTQNCLGPPLER